MVTACPREISETSWAVKAAILQVLVNSRALAWVNLASANPDKVSLVNPSSVVPVWVNLVSVSPDKGSLVNPTKEPARALVWVSLASVNPDKGSLALIKVKVISSTCISNVTNSRQAVKVNLLNLSLAVPNLTLTVSSHRLADLWPTALQA